MVNDINDAVHNLVLATLMNLSGSPEMIEAPVAETARITLDSAQKNEDASLSEILDMTTRKLQEMLNDAGINGILTRTISGRTGCASVFQQSALFGNMQFAVPGGVTASFSEGTKFRDVPGDVATQVYNELLLPKQRDSLGYDDASTFATPELLH